MIFQFGHVAIRPMLLLDHILVGPGLKLFNAPDLGWNVGLFPGLVGGGAGHNSHHLPELLMEDDRKEEACQKAGQHEANTRQEAANSPAVFTLVTAGVFATLQRKGVICTKQGRVFVVHHDGILSAKHVSIVVVLHAAGILVAVHVSASSLLHAAGILVAMHASVSTLLHAAGVCVALPASISTVLHAVAVCTAFHLFVFLHQDC